MAFFSLGVLPAIAFDLDDKVQEVALAVAIVQQNDEVREISRASET